MFGVEVTKYHHCIGRWFWSFKQLNENQNQYLWIDVNAEGTSYPYIVSFIMIDVNYYKTNIIVGEQTSNTDIRRVYCIT